MNKFFDRWRKEKFTFFMKIWKRIQQSMYSACREGEDRNALQCGASATVSRTDEIYF